MKKICVYCASSDKIDPKYFDATEILAKKLVGAGYAVVFGGGSAGLMGKLADVVLAEGGHIIGIMPDFMRQVEWAHKHVKDFHFVGDMHERKKRLLDGTEGVIALPGGCGTLEELLEVITLKRLGLYTKPIIILNQDGYYDALEEMLEKCIEERFMTAKHREMWTFISDPARVAEAIHNAPRWSQEAIGFAKV